LATTSGGIAGGFGIDAQSATAMGLSIAGAASGSAGLSSILWNPATVTTNPGLLSEWHASLVFPLDGAAFARLAREARPGLPILIITSYASDLGLGTDLPTRPKPFRQADVAAALSGLFEVDHKIVRRPRR
jgi:hypothetical protein